MVRFHIVRLLYATPYTEVESLTCWLVSSQKLAGTSSKPRTSHGTKANPPRARNDYDEETAYDSYMNPDPGFESARGTL